MNHENLINEVNTKLATLLADVKSAYWAVDDTLEPIEDLEFMLGKDRMESIFNHLDFAVSELAQAQREIRELSSRIDSEFEEGNLLLSEEYIEQEMDKELFKEYKRG